MKLQTETINRLADRIEACEEVEFYDATPGMGPAFNMSSVVYECGAPACLIGHSDAMHGRSYGDRGRNANLAVDLGITEEQADELCAPERDHADYCVNPGDPGYITKEHAAAVLRHLAGTGMVDWKIGAADDSAA